MLALALATTLAAAPAQRHFHVEQTYSVPAGEPVTLWLPLPREDAWQTVSDLRIDGAPFEVVHDSRYGDAAARLEARPGARVTVAFDVLRRERGADPSKATGALPPNGYARWLQPDRLVQLDARVRKLAAEITAGQRTPLEKARAIYAYVLGHMKYAKHGRGWGTGSITWACDARYGNCTDFHALLIGLLRASGIPARFHIGYPVPPTASGEIAGYHCWADFYLEGAGWVPVDASEGWKDASKRGYFFGHHDANRFALSLGRDVSLPGMKGPPLNYFVYAYAEDASGHAVEIGHATRFAELP